MSLVSVEGAIFVFVDGVSGSMACLTSGSVDIMGSMVLVASIGLELIYVALFSSVIKIISLLVSTHVSLASSFRVST